jgi:hypothetical protein
VLHLSALCADANGIPAARHRLLDSDSPSVHRGVNSALVKEN